MDRSVSEHTLSVQIIRSNLGISTIRLIVEHQYAFMKRMFQFAHVMVTTVERLRVKTYFTAICYNLMMSLHLDKIV